MKIPRELRQLAVEWCNRSCYFNSRRYLINMRANTIGMWISSEPGSSSSDSILEIEIFTQPKKWMRIYEKIFKWTGNVFCCWSAMSIVLLLSIIRRGMANGDHTSWLVEPLGNWFLLQCRETRVIDSPQERWLNLNSQREEYDCLVLNCKLRAGRWNRGC